MFILFNSFNFVYTNTLKNCIYILIIYFIIFLFCIILFSNYKIFRANCLVCRMAEIVDYFYWRQIGRSVDRQMFFMYWYSLHINCALVSKSINSFFIICINKKKLKCRRRATKLKTKQATQIYEWKSWLVKLVVCTRRRDDVASEVIRSEIRFRRKWDDEGHKILLLLRYQPSTEIVSLYTLKCIYRNARFNFIFIVLYVERSTRRLYL